MNVFEPGPKGPKETVEILFEDGAVRIEKITSYGHTSPPGFWYDQEEAEWVTLLAGEARVGFLDGSAKHLAAGETLLIPAHCRHRVEATSSPAVWLCVFSKPSL